MCKYVTFYTLSFLSPTPSIQYHLLPFSSSYFILTSIQPSNSSHKCYLSTSLSVQKNYFLHYPSANSLLTARAARLYPSCYTLTLPSPFAPRYSSFLHFPVATFPLSKVASNSWICALRERSMCKEECFPLVPMA